MSSFILLDVPHVGQLDIGGHTGHVSHSEQNGCWYASTCMVSYFWEAGPRLGVPAQYAANPKDPEGMGARYASLKANENFEGVPLPAAKKWTIQKLYNVLENYGPCYVRRGFRDAVSGKLEGGHAVVLAGANLIDGTVCILDPWFTKDKGGAGADKWRQHHSLAQFNDFFKWDELWAPNISLMYKKQSNAIAAVGHIKKNLDLMWW